MIFLYIRLILIFLVNINFIINLKLLIFFDGIEKLINDKIFNFHVTIISGWIENKLKVLLIKLIKYVTFIGRFLYDIMYEYISNQIFFILI